MQNLPSGGMRQIAKKVGCTDGHVNAVMNGKRSDNYGIIKEGELLAAINIWKDRFCKYTSEL